MAKIALYLYLYSCVGIKYGMAISRQTVWRIRAIADDERGEPATRAIAQKKLADLQYIPRGFYNDIANCAKTTHKYKQTKALKTQCS